MGGKRGCCSAFILALVLHYTWRVRITLAVCIAVAAMLPDCLPALPACLPVPLACPQEEEVEKSCESCGGANLPHSLRHTIRRLPRVLVLHMKRFKVRKGGPVAVFYNTCHCKCVLTCCRCLQHCLCL